MANSTEFHGNSRPTRLPEFQLPRFGGAYMDLLDFYAMFNMVVETNEHLRSCLDGTALDTIRL